MTTVSATATKDFESFYNPFPNLAINFANGTDDYAGDSSTSGSLPGGGSTTGVINFDGDDDWFRVNLVAGVQYRFDVDILTSGATFSFDPWLRVFTPSGSQLRSSLDGFLFYTPSVSGTYYVEVADWLGSVDLSPMTYRVSMSGGGGSAPPSTPPPSTPPAQSDDFGATAATSGSLAVGSSATGEIEFDNDEDWFAVSLERGETYKFTLSDFGGVILNPYLSVYSPSGQRLENTSLEEVTFSAQVTGTYYIGVSDQWFSNISGTSYRVSAENLNDDFGEGIGTLGLLVPNTPLEGRIDFDNDDDWFAIRLNANESYRFDLEQISGLITRDPDLRLYDAQGNLVDSSIFGQISYTPSTTAVFFVSVYDGWSFSDLTDTRYSITANRFTDDFASNSGTSGRLDIGGSQTATLDFNDDEDWFRVELTEFASYRFSVEEVSGGTGRDPWVYVYNGDGARVASSLEGYVDFVAPSGGTYYVAVSDWASRDLSGLTYRLLSEETEPPPDDESLWKQENQWHVSDTGSGTNGLRTDVNVSGLWEEGTGTGIRIGIVDSGIEYTHPNLIENYDTSADFDAFDGDNDSFSEGSDENHGTAVSGAAAAVSALAEDGTGIAPGATLIGYRLDFEQFSLFNLQRSLLQQVNVDVSNNSWSFVNFFNDNFLNPEFADAANALRAGVDEGRDGLGTSWVFAAGNGRQNGENANYHNFQNSRFTIAVGATSKDGTIADFSNPGASILISAPGEEILTTDRTGFGLGYSQVSDYATVDGTSFAAPLVTGVIALMYEANPNLGYRDVQTILAHSARHEPLSEGGWQTNGASTWNGGGLRVSHDYGFGLVDAHAAVRLAETWPLVSVLSNESVVSASNSQQVAIPDDNATGISSTLTLASGVQIEHVEVKINISHSYVGDLRIVLVSPNGTESVLMDRPGVTAFDSFGSSDNDINFVFTSVQYLGENSSGQWTLRVSDNEGQDIGNLVSWTLSAYGQAQTDDDVYVYTDEYAWITDLEPGRSTLTDSAGHDVLNLAAITTNVDLNLAPGSSNTLAGKDLQISSSTVIEDAFLGDGDDTVSGNDQDNRLLGGRGNDTLRGLQGDDILDGGAGSDVLEGGAGDDTYYLDASSDVVTELADSGTDRVFTSVDLVIPENVETLISISADGLVLEGSSRNDGLYGGAGDDEIVAYFGNDRLVGGPGDDYLHGGPGDDEFFGEQGDDTLLGGAGSDTYYFSDPTDAAGFDLIPQFDVGPGGDKLDLTALLDAVDYDGVDPQSDGFISLSQNGTNTDILFDADGGGDSYTTIARLQNTDANSIVDENLIT